MAEVILFQLASFGNEREHFLSITEAQGVTILVEVLDEGVKLKNEVVAVLHKEVSPHFFVHSCDACHVLKAAGGEAAVVGTTVDPSVVAANPSMMLFISALALVTNIAALCWIVSISRKRHINPYKEDVFVEQKYYKDAMARAVVD